MPFSQAISSNIFFIYRDFVHILKVTYQDRLILRAFGMARLLPASLIVPLLASAFPGAAEQPENAAPAAYQDGRRAFVSSVAAEHGLDPARIGSLLDQACYSQPVIDAITRPHETKPWFAYRRIFLTPQRISDGSAFLLENRTMLEQAQARWGVPAAILTAILGIETNYGRNLGQHRVIDALSTLGFAYPPRADFFRGELAQLLLLSSEEALDPLSIRGSYAGAVGQAQFIPSSYRAYAVDFDEDGRRDLWHSRADAIGSIANYLAEHGWQPGAPVAAPARLTEGPPAGVAIGGRNPVEPRLALGSLRGKGIETDPGLPDTLTAALFGLQRKEVADGAEPPREYWLGFDNFYAITRYNHSTLYAMAVYQLSRAIAGHQAVSRR
jgi:membrane-bound lytic murein transglycosylase B